MNSSISTIQYDEKSYEVKKKFDKTPYFFLAPAFTIMLLILIIPIFVVIFISMTDANILTLSQSKFIGIDNYINFFQSSSVKKVFNATIYYVVGGVILMYVIGLISALLINQCKKLKFLFRTLTILPLTIPEVVLVLLWKWMLNPQYGVLNFILNKLGIIPTDFTWFSSSEYAIIGLLMITVWKLYPISFLMIFAGLQTIPIELYEAASIDGGSSIKKFWYITLPGLKYISSGLILLLMIWQIRSFTIVWLTTKGGPSDATAMLTIYSYLNAFKFNKFGYGAAIGFITVLVALIITILYYKIIIKKLGTE